MTKIQKVSLWIWPIFIVTSIVSSILHSQIPPMGEELGDISWQYIWSRRLSLVGGIGHLVILMIFAASYFLQTRKQRRIKAVFTSAGSVWVVLTVLDLLTFLTQNGWGDFVDRFTGKVSPQLINLPEQLVYWAVLLILAYLVVTIIDSLNRQARNDSNMQRDGQ